MYLVIYNETVNYLYLYHKDLLDTRKTKYEIFYKIKKRVLNGSQSKWVYYKNCL